MKKEIGTKMKEHGSKKRTSGSGKELNSMIRNENNNLGREKLSIPLKYQIRHISKEIKSEMKM